MRINKVIYRTKLLYSSAAAFLFFIFNYLLINKGHFHEDAYILFIYVENLLHGNGITFYPGGPHTEGATDFLWLIMLSVLGKIGFDVGTAVILLNSIGVLIITYLIINEIQCSELNSKLFILLYPFAFIWIFQQPLVAAVGGFSVYLYMALVLVAFITVFKDKYILYTPYIGLAIALFRPDGVIIGVGFTLIGLIPAFKTNRLKPYIIGVIFSLIVGVSYFIWRYNYFGNLLPLPLYVKSHGNHLAGIGYNVDWVKKNFYILIPVLILSIKNKKFWEYLFLSCPLILLFLALLTATQSQNVGYRFQAPILIIVYFILVVSMIAYLREHNLNKINKKLLVILLLVFFLTNLNYIWETRSIVRFSYINQVPLAINSVIPNNSTIVLTEAGRMAYWNQTGGHKIIDIIGLNNEYPAKNNINVKYLDKITPDVMMYHHCALLDIEDLKRSEEFVVPLNKLGVKYLVNKKEYNEVQRHKIKKSRIASIVATEYLQKHFNEYDIFIVDYKEDQSYSHVYAFKKSLHIEKKINSILTKSFNKNRALSYYEMKELRVCHDDSIL